MFNKKSKWYNKMVEKPRLFFHLMALIFFFVPIMVPGIKGHLSTIALVAIGIDVAVGIGLIVFSWTSSFKKIFNKN